MKIAEEMGDKHAEESACRGLGQVYWNLGDLKEAIEKHKRCFKICKELGEKSRQRSVWGFFAD